MAAVAINSVGRLLLGLLPKPSDPPMFVRMRSTKSRYRTETSRFLRDLRRARSRQRMACGVLRFASVSIGE
jgi:hypothetical protein